MERAKAKGFGKKGWGILFLTFFSVLINSMIIYDSLNVTIGAFAERFGLQNPSLLYIFSTIGAWISVPGAVFFGWLCGKKNCRFAWGIALLINAAVTLLWSISHSTGLYFICLAVCNVCGMGFGYIASFNVISNWYPTKKGLAMGFVTIGFPLSATIATPLCSGLLNGVGLSGIYYLFTVVCVVLGILVLIFVRDYPEQSGAFPDNNKEFDREEADRRLAEGLEYMKTSEWQPKKFLKTANVWKIVFSLGVMELFSLGVMTNFVPRMLQIGYTITDCTPMLACAGLVACVGSYLCGVLDSKVGPKKAVIITFLFGILSLVVNIAGGYVKLAGFNTAAYIMLFAAQPFLGIMLGGAANYLVSIISTIWGRYDFDNGYRVMKPAVVVLGALGITICGAIGNTLSMGYTYAYALLCVLCIIAVIVASKINDTYVGKKD